MNFFKKLRLEREAGHEPGGIYDRMAKYQGSPEYQAMLERNGGVAPGCGTLSFRGSRGGRYRMSKTGRSRVYF